MDAPALPPSQSTVPALVSAADSSSADSTDVAAGETMTLTELALEDLNLEDLNLENLNLENLNLKEPNSEKQPTLLSQSLTLNQLPEIKALPINTLPKVALSGIHAIDFSLLSRTDISHRPIGWIPSPQLAHSFGFMSRAFRSARLDSALRFSRLSATIPIQWARSNDWKSWARIAEIQVSPVAEKPTVTQQNSADWTAPFVNQCQLGEQRLLANASVYKLSLKETTLGYVADRDQAYLLAQQLEQLLHRADFEPNEIGPQASDSSRLSNFKITADDKTLLSISESMAEAVGYSKEWAAIAWANNLRTALESEPLSVGATQMALQRMKPSDITLKGEASWYGPYFHGRATANGETYNQHDLTVAHKSLPFGTHLKVRNLQNDRTVVVRVNDRGPYVGDRSLDLSNAAAKCLGSDEAGVIPYEAVILNEAKS